MTQTATPVGRSRLIIVVIALTALVPFALAWYYARHPELIEKTSNYGALIVPVRQLDLAGLEPEPAAATAPTESIRGRWVLLQVADGPCDAACAETLHKTHQGWLMLNKEMPRVKRLLLLGDPGKAREDAAIARDDALLTAGLPPSARETLAAAIGRPPVPGMVVLLDPLGNLVLWYDAGFDPYRMVKDLKHLLKASRIG